MHILMFFAISTCWGASFILTKKCSVLYPAAAMGVWRLALGGLVLGLMWRFLQPGFHVKWNRWKVITAVSTLTLIYPYAVQPWLVQRLGSGLVGAAMSLNPVFTLVLTPFLLRKRPTPRQIMGVLTAFLLLILALGPAFPEGSRSVEIAALLAIPLCVALSSIFLRRYASGEPPLELTTYIQIFAAVVLLPFTFLSQPAAAPITPSEWWVANASLLVMGVFGTGLAVYWFNVLVREQSPLYAVMVANLLPLWALFWGWVDGEPVTLLQGACMLGVLGVVVWVQCERLPVAMATTVDPSVHEDVVVISSLAASSAVMTELAVEAEEAAVEAIPMPLEIPAIAGGEARPAILALKPVISGQRASRELCGSCSTDG